VWGSSRIRAAAALLLVVLQLSGQHCKAVAECEVGEMEAEGVLEVQVVQGRIALVTLAGNDAESKFAWGTRVCEHRINPILIAQVNHALDLALENKEVSAVVVAGQGKFFSNGMDLKWIDAHPDQADQLQADAEALLARILTFPLPTIAAINGHFCAAGAMLGLAFDYRISVPHKALFFVPAIHLGLIYSKGMTELMKSKTPVHMHNELIVYGKRYTPQELEQEHVVKQLCSPEALIAETVQFAFNLTESGKFLGQKYRDTMRKIKTNTYQSTYTALTDARNFQGMGFDSGSWDEHGRSKL